MMHSRSSARISSCVALALGVSVHLVACSNDTSSPGGGAGTGGTTGSGGSPGSGGSTGSGGSPGTGGTTGSGGSPGSGGSMGSGGAPGTGGRTGSGGRTGMGGTTGPGGSPGSGGSPGTGGTTGPGGSTGAGGAASSGGRTGSGGVTGAGGLGGQGGATGRGGAQGTGGSTVTGLAKFSFFVTSIEVMRKLSNNQNGFGGDLRFGEADGLAGADKICTQVAESSMAGSSAKVWRAFLSTTTGGSAVDRIGSGPWYDRLGRLVADSKANLAQPRPKADAAITNDLPNENGVPNHQNVDNHDVLTGSTTTGTIGSNTTASTCNNWTSTSTSGFKPIVGHSWPRNGTGGTDSASNWMNSHTAPGCAPSVVLTNTMGGGTGGVGDGGGYGAIYCFALAP